MYADIPSSSEDEEIDITILSHEVVKNQFLTIQYVQEKISLCFL